MGLTVKKVFKFFAPDAEKEEDGRDKWPSRAAFVLAAMGGAVGLGNLLRYPSVVFANNGLAWFIPYFIALIFLGLPTLILEISIGQAYRGSVVVAFNGINKHTKGLGLAVIMTGFLVATYYVPILAWILHYFRASFQSPLPWTGRGREFYMEDVIANLDLIARLRRRLAMSSTRGGAWLARRSDGAPSCGSSFGCACSRGIKYYFAEWNGWRLGNGDIWQGACGQIFFSIRVGFGYFTSYVSYNSKYANTVQDALIIASCNSMYEIVAGFAVFGVIGFLGYSPDDSDISLSTFTVGFLTYPLGLAEMPGSNVWSVLFFFALAVLGLGSAFALVESLVALICGYGWTRKYPRTPICSTIIVAAILLSLLYCTEFGFWLLVAVDTWINNLIGHILSMVLGDAVGQAAGPEAGAGTGFGVFVLTNVVAVLLSKTPDSEGNQLRRDLNVVIATGKNWGIPVFWGVILRYVSAPILAIVVSFAYPAFYLKR
ncbi:hypothetical protein ACJZ2D_003872 [Fusarium nematophilum]